MRQHPRSDAIGPLRVLQSFPGRGAQTNPYLLQLVDSLPADVATSYFSWRTALSGAYDVLHVHWPERLVRGTSPARTLFRMAAFVALLARIRAQRVPVVRTVHNPSSHESRGRLERLLLAALDRRTTVWHRLNPLTVTPATTVTIPHGDYRDWFAGRQDVAAQPGRILFFGLVRPYKGVEDLIAAFRALPDPRASLRIVGLPATAELRSSLSASVAAENRASASWTYASEEELYQEVRRSQVVVLPYRELHNSGAALLALSLDRPVLVPRNDVTEWLRNGVGPEWVLTFEPPLTAEHLASALAATAGPPSSGPDLEDHAWPRIGRMHAEAYRIARAMRHGGPVFAARIEKEHADVQSSR